MLRSTIRRYGRRLHDLSEDYVCKGKDSGRVQEVKGLICEIDEHRYFLSGLATRAHELFMHSMREDTPEEFMEHVLSKCCIYTV